MTTTPFRPPAIPLITIDPYFSLWSFDDTLTGGPVRHWTGALQPLYAFLRLDGKPFRIIGAWPPTIPVFPQKSVTVLPTRTVYVYEGEGIRLVLSFITPALPDDLLRLSWPITYIDFSFEVLDGRARKAELYFEVPAEIAANDLSDSVVAIRPVVEGLTVLGIGTRDQRILEAAGDNRRIDWGWAYLAIPPGQFERTIVSVDNIARDNFFDGKAWPTDDFLDFPVPIKGLQPKLACSTEFSLVAGGKVSRHLILAYDDLFSIEYHHRKLRPYWRAQGLTAPDLLRAAAAEYTTLRARCEAFDAKLMGDLVRAGGEEYAALAALSYRQCLAAHKLCQDIDGTLLYFSKENFSNGCIATVDVTYPSSPFFLLFQPELLRAQLIPILDYALSPRWKFPFAPHDLGCYPQANGQVYGGCEHSEKDQMPVEECGNMLILVAALGKRTGDWRDAERCAPLLRKWAEYLEAKGLDPEEQLCTDDFAGHLAHNTNLSLKAIVGLRCYAEICTGIGNLKSAEYYKKTAHELMSTWEANAFDSDSDNYRLTFDRKQTWSQKYNLVWDQLLGLGLISRQIIDRELAFYRTVEQKYGLPLDSRTAYTKLDWLVWTATLASDKESFRQFILPAYRWANETPSRVPLTDWYWTDSGLVAGFQARSVVGGLFIKLLSDQIR